MIMDEARVSTGYSIAIIVVVAACTLFLRAVPFLIFGRKKKVPEWIHYLGQCLPPAIMATLVIYSLRSIRLFEGNHGLPELLSLGLVIVLHGWKRNILLSVLSGTVCYMVIIHW